MGPEGEGRARGYAAAIICAVFSGFTLTLGKLVLGSMPTITFALYLYVLAVPLSAVWAILADGRRIRLPAGPARRYVLAQSGLSFIAMWLMWAGVARLHPAVVSSLGRTETLLTLALGVLLLGERFTRQEAVGAVVAVAGVVTMKSVLGADVAAARETVGFWLVLGSAASFGLAEYVAKLAVGHITPATFTLWRNALLVPPFALAALASKAAGMPSASQMVVILAAALLGPTAARGLYMISLGTLELSKAAVVNQSQPIFAALLALALLGELPSAQESAGGLLLVAGCALVVGGSSWRGRRIAGGGDPVRVRHQAQPESLGVDEPD